ncbi:hypothetical protein G7Y89_g4469 [Cudoniella acicularis]|uniref:Uncharacterized protein n=1 Tax=Cudoniella acicularis TaxID=354080 RepID=A0A8H4RPE1_9HELO|nr:hypothetical protein G7Y89_g4469 [Cudoniella acicularis]
MSGEDEIYVTSRSRAPSIIDVKSQNERVFAQLPDIIQEAAVSTEFSSPNLQISRVQNMRLIESKFMTQPTCMFYITPRRDSGIEMPDLNVTDEKFLGKYGLDLTANFADIKVHGAKAFFQKQNLSTGSTYSLSVCATGYIWVNVRFLYRSEDPREFSDLEIQIGTYALKASAITTVEIPCQYRCIGLDDPLDGDLALLCSTVLAKYLRLRMMGQQYEYAAETAMKESHKELAHLWKVDAGQFGNLDSVLKEICKNAPMPPISDVSLISRSMITGRWKCWRERSVLRRRYFFPRRVIRCFRNSRNDSIDLLSGCFQAIAKEKARLSLVQK